MKNTMLRAAILAALTIAAPLHAQTPQQAERKGPSIEAFHDGFGREVNSLTLQREAVMAALASLDRDVAGLVADQIFRDYAQAAGRAREEVAAALFPRKDGKPARTELAPTEMASAAKRFEQQWVEATDTAIAALARAGSSDETSAKDLTADLYRRLLATAEPISLEMLREDRLNISDAMSLWREALDRDPILGPSRSWIGTHPRFTAAFERFRREGERLGRERFKGIAERTMFYAEPEPERIPAELRLDRNRSKAARRAWRTENHTMAEAIEEALRSGPSNEATSGQQIAGAGPLPAARWALHYLGIARSDAVPSNSTTRSMVAFAESLGVSPAEAAAIRSALDDSTIQQAAIFRRIVRAYDEWEGEAIKQARRTFDSPPPEKLVKAYDDLDSLDAATKTRILAAIQSPFVRKRTKIVGEQPLPPHVLPMWRGIQTGQVRVEGVSWGQAAPGSNDAPAGPR